MASLRQLAEVTDEASVDTLLIISLFLTAAATALLRPTAGWV
jgi:hypothetical protein